MKFKKSISLKQQESRMLSIITVNYRSSKDIAILLRSIVKYEPCYREYEFIIVDNNSNDSGLLDIKKRYPFVSIIHAPLNGGFAYGNNIGIRHSRGDYVLLLNPDTYIVDNSIHKLYHRLHDDGIDFIGPKLLAMDGSNNSYYSPKTYLTLWKLFCETFYLYKIFKNIDVFNSYYRTTMDYNKENYVESIGGAALMFKRKVIDKIGLLDEKYFMYFEENDYCLHAVKNGYKLLYYPESHIYHIGGSIADSYSELTAKSYVNSFKYYFMKNFKKAYLLAVILFFVRTLIRIILFLIIKDKRYNSFIKHLKYLFYK